MNEKLREDAYRYAIRNAAQHQGKADLNALIGKIMALHKDVDLIKAMPLLKAIVEDVNALSEKEIQQEFQRFEKGYELKIPEKKVGLKDLEWAEKEEVVTRYAPNPSAPMHLGHSRPAILSYLYAKKYNGKFILRFDDTDPKVKQPLAEGEQLFIEDLSWLNAKPDMAVRASDRLDIYHSYMRQLLEKGHAYVCTCDQEKWKEQTLQKKACLCRDKKPQEHAERFNKMLHHEYKQEEAVLRIKTDLNASDPAERDWWAAKVVDKPKHYRVKDVFVWPSYNFASAIDDHLLGITLIIRGQEHASNVKKQKWVYTHFGWVYPHSFHHGRLMIKGAELSKSKILEGIKNKQYSGWDDPRLYTLQSLRRRGFQPEAIQTLIIELGVKTSDTLLSEELLAQFNRDYLQEKGNYGVYTYVEEPVQLSVGFCPTVEAEQAGRVRELAQGNQVFFVSKKDVKNLKKDEVVKLKGAYNIRVNSINEFQADAAYVSSTKLENKPMLHWILEGSDVEITLNDNRKRYGLCDSEIREEKEGRMVFLEGLGFCRVDYVNEKRVGLWFTHA
ncbi:MAG: glutamate--tRNA ligase [Candidatus Diapherotrites archaeon]|nr:glutamate--tRNA ligase [Candidatus Diapherotrites archaeon]